MDQRVYLKVKIKSLAAEAKIIRAEERKNKYFRTGLSSHRKTVVRSEARHTLLAYGFLKGKRYRDLEPTAKNKPDWDRVRRMVEKYGIKIPDSYTHTPEHGFRSQYQKKLSAQELERFEEWKTETIATRVRGDQKGAL